MTGIPPIRQNDSSMSRFKPTTCPVSATLICAIPSAHEVDDLQQPDSYIPTNAGLKDL